MKINIAALLALSLPGAAWAKLANPTSKICHYDKESGLCGKIEKPSDSVAKFLEESELDFEMAEGAEVGCCLDGCDPNCGGQRKLQDEDDNSQGDNDDCDGDQDGEGYYDCYYSDYYYSSGEGEGDGGGRRNRKLCISMECCADLSGGAPKCVPEGTCKLIHAKYAKYLKKGGL